MASHCFDSEMAIEYYPIDHKIEQMGIPLHKEIVP
jgi:hypothetical protein